MKQHYFLSKYITFNLKKNYFMKKDLEKYYVLYNKIECFDFTQNIDF